MVDVAEMARANGVSEDAMIESLEKAENDRDAFSFENLGARVQL